MRTRFMIQCFVALLCVIVVLGGLSYCVIHDHRDFVQERAKAEDLRAMSKVAFALQGERAREAQQQQDCSVQKCSVGMPFLVKDACWCVAIVGTPVKP